MKKILLVLPLILVLLFAGCVQPGTPENNSNQTMPGSDRDAHGCIPSAGYSWCDAKQKCIRAWEENCTVAASCTKDSDCITAGCSHQLCVQKDQTDVFTTCEYSSAWDCLQYSSCGCVNGACAWAQNQQYTNCLNNSNTPPGSDKDAHGCIPSAGYQWCEATQKCYRSWEENCTAQIVGNDKDAHGCIPSAGYTWCEAKQKCIRPWEENCTQLVGNDRDEHGCIPSAGYSWCQYKQKCYRPWEENCTDSNLEPKARTYCGQENVAAVYVCGPYIRTVSSLMGGGSTFYDANSTKIVQCPVVGPDSMSDQCKQLLLGNNCVEQQVC